MGKNEWFDKAEDRIERIASYFPLGRANCHGGCTLNCNSDNITTSYRCPGGQEKIRLFRSNSIQRIGRIYRTTRKPMIFPRRILHKYNIIVPDFPCAEYTIPRAKALINILRDSTRIVLIRLPRDVYSFDLLRNLFYIFYYTEKLWKIIITFSVNGYTGAGASFDTLRRNSMFTSLDKRDF